jgi:thioredoxin 1
MKEFSMGAANVLAFDKSNFDDKVLKSASPVLVDFWAEWCGPCRMLTPTIEKLATDYASKLTVGKIDTDSNTDLAAKYSIDSIPTVLLFKGGQVVKKFVGLRKEKDFKEAIDAIL